MRIAVLVYGRLGKGEDFYENFINNIGNEHEIIFFMSSDNAHENDLNLFIKAYKPVKYINDRIVVPDNLFPREVSESNMIRHFINKHRVFSLLEKYIESEKVNFDIVFTTRIEVYFYKKRIFDNIEENTIYIPQESDYGGINDHWAYGSVTTMKKYNDIYFTLPEFIEKKICRIGPEDVTLANLYYHKLNIKRVEAKYDIIR
jgi:hypothetical protein